MDRHREGECVCKEREKERVSMTSEQRSGGSGGGGGGFSPYNNTSGDIGSSSSNTLIHHDPLQQWMQERQILMLTLLCYVYIH